MRRPHDNDDEEKDRNSAGSGCNLNCGISFTTSDEMSAGSWIQNPFNLTADRDKFVTKSLLNTDSVSLIPIYVWAAVHKAPRPITGNAGHVRDRKGKTESRNSIFYLLTAVLRSDHAVFNHPDSKSPDSKSPDAPNLVRRNLATFMVASTSALHGQRRNIS